MLFDVCLIIKESKIVTSNFDIIALWWWILYGDDFTNFFDRLKFERWEWAIKVFLTAFDVDFYYFIVNKLRLVLIT